jgi:hypothetical protein
MGSGGTRPYESFRSTWQVGQVSSFMRRIVEVGKGNRVVPVLAAARAGSSLSSACFTSALITSNARITSARRRRFFCFFAAHAVLAKVVQCWTSKNSAQSLHFAVAARDGILVHGAQVFAEQHSKETSDLSFQETCHVPVGYAGHTSPR